MRLKVILFLILAFSSFSFTNALTQNQNGECVEALVSQINPVNLKPNEDFIVGIEISNCGDVIPKNISFKVTQYSPDIIIKDPLSYEIGELSFSNSKRFITLHMRTTQNPFPGEHIFKTELIYGGNLFVVKEYNFSINVKSELPELVLSGIRAKPELIYPNEDVILTVKIQNSGEGTAKNVKVRLEGLDFTGTKESYLGEIASGEELPARFVLRSPSKSGDFDYNIKVYYDFAQENKLEQYPSNVYVFEKNNNLYYWIIPLSFLVLIILILLVKKAYSGKQDEED